MSGSFTAIWQSPIDAPDDNITAKTSAFIDRSFAAVYPTTGGCGQK
jgi:hypothetical protein